MYKVIYYIANSPERHYEYFGSLREAKAALDLDVRIRGLVLDLDKTYSDNSMSHKIVYEKGYAE